MKVSNNLKHITVSPYVYFALKKLGGAGDSFNDVLKKILDERDHDLSFEFVPRAQTVIPYAATDQGGPRNSG